jgi:tetratricopeptide (TPR) repeat protein
MSRRSRLASLLVACLLVVPGVGCKRKSGKTPEVASGAQDSAAMGTWDAWLDLTPLLEVARGHAPATSLAAMEKASKLLRAGKAKSADRELALLADSVGRHWISIARADLAALYFTRCIRGVVWRLEDIDPKSTPTRQSDFSEATAIEPGDVSVESMLVNLDAAVANQQPVLQVQARIARARVTAYSARCAANDDVQELSEAILKGDLATLAAEGHLTPDLAFLWAGVQMADYSGAAAKPFLLIAKEGGYTDPSVVYMLGVIALEQRELDRADVHAVESAALYAKLGDKDQQAQSVFLRGEVARVRKDAKAARTHYEAALKLAPDHAAALLGITRLVLTSEGASRAVSYLQKQLPQLLFTGPLKGDKVLQAADNLEGMAQLASDSELAVVLRDTLLAEVDLETDAVRRGLRYFMAANIDARLGEYQHARAHAVLARDEFKSADIPLPIDVDAFLARIDSISAGG